MANDGLNLTANSDANIGLKNPSSDILLQTTFERYPMLKGLGLQYQYNPQENKGYSETWPVGEEGTQERPRPSAFGLGKPGIEVYDPNTRPVDIAGEVASHLYHLDPQLDAYYKTFTGSLTDKQKQLLQRQYAHEQKHYGEDRPYEVWHEMSGVPSLYRGYAFQQWPEEVTKGLYTPKQMKIFEEMISYLQQRPKKK